MLSQLIATKVDLSPESRHITLRYSSISENYWKCIRLWNSRTRLTPAPKQTYIHASTSQVCSVSGVKLKVKRRKPIGCRFTKINVQCCPKLSLHTESLHNWQPNSKPRTLDRAHSHFILKIIFTFLLQKQCLSIEWACQERMLQSYKVGKQARKEGTF